MKVLRSQPELAGVPTYVLGHSLGAILAPEIAGKDGKVAGAILLAGAARPFEDILVDQFTYLASLSPGPEAAAKLEEVRKLMDGIRKHELKPAQQVMGAPASYWYDLCGRDAEVAVKTAAALKCGILVVQGGRDYQSTVEDFKLWQTGLARHPDATFKLFDDLNHFFAAGDAKAIPSEYEDELHVDPKVITLVADWCLQPHPAEGRTSRGPQPPTP
jgi:alpha-beta hydrolase superfamily lysophospholipase